MGFLRQIAVLIRKDLTIIGLRSWFPTLLRAIILPIAYIFFISYVRNFFLPPSEYGIGSPRPVRNLTTEVFGSSTSLGGRNRVVLINNGFTGGQIDNVIQTLADPLRNAGADVRILSEEQELFGVCPSSLRGLSPCYASVEFHSSPTEGNGGLWNYTARTDYGLGFSVFVNRGNNDAQVYILPFVHAIDAAIAAQTGQILPDNMLEYPFTYETIQDRRDTIQSFYMRALTNYLAVTLFIGICGVTYHLPGYMATERESGMSHLIDAMLPSANEWHGLTVRLASLYTSFNILYIAGWIAMGAIVSQLIFYSIPASIVILFHLLTGFSLVGWSILGGTLFRKAQLSGITVLLTSLIIAVLAQFVPRYPDAVTALSALFPPATYTFFMIQLAQWEQSTRPVNLSTFPFSWEMPVGGYLFFVFLAAQIVVFPLMAGMLQRYLFGIKSRSSTGMHADDVGLAYKLVGVSKYYRPSLLKRMFGNKTVVRAVDDLSLQAKKGQVLVLLGANGSGKSTTLSAISGTHSISKGRIEIDRISGLGFCPQKNVLWDGLTVSEHVRIFNGLKCKGSPDVESEIQRLVAACDLSLKAEAKSKTLSGGQKRKLQLAMAFTGGSTICCVDEVSSGLDPLSRKIIWNILLAERGRRTLLLTTHALDEADALADDIAVMSKGRLIAQGSAVELKNAHGGGYRVSTSTAIASPAQMEGVRTVSTTDRTIHHIPDSSKACQVLSEMQKQHHRGLQFEGPTIENVFLKLAHEYEEELSEFRLSDSSTTLEQETATVEEKTVSTEKPKSAALIARGKGTSFIKQIGILFRKRILILSRNYLPYLAAVVLPIATAGLTTMFLGGFTRPICSLGALANNPRRISLPTLQRFYGLLVPVGPAQQFVGDALPPQYQQFAQYLRLQNTYEDFQGFITDNFRSVVPGGFYLGDSSADAPVMAYRINGNLGYSALAKNVMDSYLLNTTIVADFSTFALPFVGSMGDSLQLVLYFGFAMSCYPAFFALYPTFERRGNIRALHYSNGIRPGPLWLAYTSFDAIFVLLVSIVTIILFTSLSNVWFAPGYLFVVFFLFGISSTLLSYIVSLFAKTQLAAFAFLAGGQAIFLLIYFIMYMVLITFAQQEQLFHNLNIVQFTYGLITPSGNLLRALLLALNQSQLLCRGQSFVSYPADITVYGGPIFYLVLQSVAFYSFLVFYDSGWRPSFLPFINRKPASDGEEAFLENVDTPSDVARETALSQQTQAELKVLHLVKAFHGKRVVDNLTFSVPHSQVFALLGPNGAGKSTTISLIRGDIRPSTVTSDILVEDHSVRDHRLTTRRLLGVCPQFDTMDRLTVSEHLSFYARVRGVPNVKSNVDMVILAVGLSAYKNRMTAQLSGGNQRKLSLGTAIIGNPSVLLLDEPSSGMDAVSKRIMWKAIEGIKEERSVVITTHSMEEATALADKAGIMSKKLLAVGTTKDLRETHGRGKLHVHLVLKKESDMQRVHDWMIGNVKGAAIDGDMLHGQLRFVVTKEVEETDTRTATRTDESDEDSSTAELVDLLKLLEENKQILGIEYYSVSPTTLEDVFLSIAAKARLSGE